MAKLTEEQKSKILEKMREFQEIHAKMEKFEEYLRQVQEEHNNILNELKNIREEEQKMVESFNLDEEGKKSYNEFVTSLVMGKLQESDK